MKSSVSLEGQDPGNVPEFLHKNVKLRTNKMRSAQGNVFFVKVPGFKNEIVLKQYPIAEYKSFQRDLTVLNSILHTNKDKREEEKVQGFPKLISYKRDA